MVENRPSRNVRRAAKQGMPVMAGRTIRQWAGDIKLLLTGKREITRTVPLKMKDLRAGDLIPEFGSEKVTHVKVDGATTTVHFIGLDGSNPWSVPMDSERVLEVRPVQRGRDPRVTDIR
jgi:hypothetical protein